MQLSRSRRQSPSHRSPPPSACHTLIGMRESSMISIPSGCKFRKCGFCLSACCFWNPAGTRSLLAGAPPGLGNYAGIYGGMVRVSSETLAETGSNLACLGCFINSHFKRKVNYSGLRSRGEFPQEGGVKTLRTGLDVWAFVLFNNVLSEPQCRQWSRTANL